MINAEITGAKNIGLRNGANKPLREIQMIITAEDAVAFRIGQIVRITTLAEITEGAIDGMLKGEPGLEPEGEETWGS